MYKPCGFCGGEVIDGEPHYIPFGMGSVLEIIDQKCKNCGANIVGSNQKKKVIKIPFDSNTPAKNTINKEITQLNISAVKIT